jgi:hypothetical protein
MKRILLALGISTILLIIYLILSAVIVFAASPDHNHFNMQVVNTVDIPLRLPKYVVYYFFPPTPEDYRPQLTGRKAILAIVVYAANIVLYGIPVYLVLSIVARYRRKPADQINEQPPPPPDRLDAD